MTVLARSDWATSIYCYVLFVAKFILSRHLILEMHAIKCTKAYLECSFLYATLLVSPSSCVPTTSPSPLTVTSFLLHQYFSLFYVWKESCSNKLRNLCFFTDLSVCFSYSCTLSRYLLLSFGQLSFKNNHFLNSQPTLVSHLSEKQHILLKLSSCLEERTE